MEQKCVKARRLVWTHVWMCVWTCSTCNTHLIMIDSMGVLGQQVLSCVHDDVALSGDESAVLSDGNMTESIDTGAEYLCKFQHLDPHTCLCSRLHTCPHTSAHLSVHISKHTCKRMLKASISYGLFLSISLHMVASATFLTSGNDRGLNASMMICTSIA